MADYKRTISPSKHLAYLRQGVGRVMAGSIHTLTSCLSMLRVWVEAAWKQSDCCLEYGKSMGRTLLMIARNKAEELIKSSFVFLLWLGVGSWTSQAAKPSTMETRSGTLLPMYVERGMKRVVFEKKNQNKLSSICNTMCL